MAPLGIKGLLVEPGPFHTNLAGRSAGREPPLRLLLGKVAPVGARATLDMLARDFDTWAEVTERAHIPAPDPS